MSPPRAAAPAAGGLAAFLALGVVGVVAAAFLDGRFQTLGLAIATTAAVAVAWVRPVYAVVAVVFFVSRVMTVDSVDIRLPIGGGGGLELPDLALLGSLFVLALRELTARRLTVPWWPVTLPLFVFLSLGVFSTAYAVLYQGVEVHRTLGELRALAFYATCLLVAWSIRCSRDRRALVTGLFLVADVTVALIIGQQFVEASRPLVPAMADRQWHVWAERTVGGSVGGVRVVPPAHVLVHLMMLVGFAGLVTPGLSRGRRAFFGAQFCLLSLGLLLTYTRAEWIVGGLGVVALLLVMARRLLLAGSCAAVGVGAVVLLYGAGQGDVGASKAVPFVQVLSARARSIFSVAHTARSNSLQWRVFEREEAMRSMAEHPLLGVGLGSAYRALTIVQGESHFTLGMGPEDRSEAAHYLHNSYLAIGVKMGLPALASYLWFCAAFVVAGVARWRGLPVSETRSTMLAMLTAFVGVLGWSVFHSNLVDDPGACVMGVMVGLGARCGALRNVGLPPGQQVPGA